jgi:LysR family transcriptional regulator, glycine cleavage system transcriptional activator
MTHSLPPLEALQAVLGAASTGSFSAAAGLLDITHGAVSRRVAVVELWAGAIIFERHGRGVRPTLEGQRLVARIEQALAMLEDTRLAGASDVEPETVRVGVVQSFARLWLIPHLRELEGTPRDVRIEPEIDHRHMTLSDARIAIRLGRGDWSGVEARRLFSETLQPYASPAVAARIRPDAAAADLLACPLIHDASDANWRLWLGQTGLEQRSRDRTFPGYDLTLLAAADGHGIVMVRDPYGRDLRERLGLVPVSERSVANPQAFHLVVAPGRMHAAVERLAQRIIALASLQPGG